MMWQTQSNAASIASTPLRRMIDMGESKYDHYADEFVDDGECGNCDGEGFTYGCSWDWQCDTYDEGEGSCLCMRRCDWCNPVKLTDEQKQEQVQAALQAILSEALKATP